MDRDALAQLLRHRRQHLQPGDVAMSAGPRRRVPGLRREEVAQLAGISIDYYTRLEQRRAPQPSTQVLASLARALRLTADERDYLYRIAGHAVPDRRGEADHIAPALHRVFDRLDDTPALIISHLGETLIANPLAIALFGDHTHATGCNRYEAYRWFARPESERGHYPTEYHPQQSRALVSGLRAVHAATGSTPRTGKLIAELLRTSDEFRELWAQQLVARRFADHKVLLHPELGAIEVDCQVLLTEDQTQALLVLTPEPRSDAEQKLQLLRVLGMERFERASRA